MISWKRLTCEFMCKLETENTHVGGCKPEETLAPQKFSHRFIPSLLLHRGFLLQLRELIVGLLPLLWCQLGLVFTFRGEDRLGEIPVHHLTHPPGVEGFPGSVHEGRDIETSRASLGDVAA